MFVVVCACVIFFPKQLQGLTPLKRRPPLKARPAVLVKAPPISAPVQPKVRPRPPPPRPKPKLPFVLQPTALFPGRPITPKPKLLFVLQPRTLFPGGPPPPPLPRPKPLVVLQPTTTPTALFPGGPMLWWPLPVVPKMKPPPPPSVLRSVREIFVWPRCSIVSFVVCLVCCCCDCCCFCVCLIQPSNCGKVAAAPSFGPSVRAAAGGDAAGAYWQLLQIENKQQQQTNCRCCCCCCCAAVSFLMSVSLFFVVSFNFRCCLFVCLAFACFACFACLLAVCPSSFFY